MLRLWDVATGKELRQFHGHLTTPGWILFSPDGRTLASRSVAGSGTDGTIRLWDVATGKQMRLLEYQIPMGRGWCRLPLAFSPDGRRLAFCGPDDAAVHLWNISTGKEHRWSEDPRAAMALAFAPDGKVLAAAAGEDLWLMDVNFGHSRKIALRDCPGGIRALGFAPDGRVIASANANYRLAPDGKSFLWDQPLTEVHWWAAATGKEIRRLNGTLIAASANGKWLAIHQGGEVVVWNMAADNEAQRFPFADAVPPRLLADDELVGSFSADGHILAIPEAGRIHILDTHTRKEQLASPGHSDDVVFVAFSPDGSRLISAADRSVRFWEPRTGRELGSLRGPTDAICSASMSADGKTLAAGTRANAIHVWDLHSGKELRKLSLEPRCYPYVALAPDGKALAFKALGGPFGIRLVSVGTGEELRCFGYGNQTEALAFLPDGSAVADLCSSICLFDSRTGVHLRTLVEPNNGGSWAGMAISTDSRLVATGYPDRARGKVQPMDTVSLWEAASGKLVAQFRGHRWQVCSFAFAHGGRVVASGGRDGTVRLWDLATGKELRRFDGHRGAVLSLAFSPDDTLLASGGADTTVLVWDVAEVAANRPLPAARLSREEMERLWADLGSDSAGTAHRALWRLAAGGKGVTAFLGEKLGPACAAERAVRKLIADLDADEFNVREAAMRKLSDLGKQARPLLEETRERPQSLEVQQRVETLLARIAQPGPPRAPVGVQHIRAVQAVEYGHLPGGRQLLQTLAEKEPNSSGGLAAQAALKRLAERRR